MQFMLNGYTGRCKLDSYATMMTSYSLSVATNVIKSQASIPLWRNKKFNRIAGLAVRDYPTYNLSISIEVTESLLWYLLKKLGKNGCRDSFKVEFIDHAYGSGLKINMSKCYLTQLDLNISNNAAATVQLGFAYFEKTFEMDYGKYTTKNKHNAESTLVGPVLMGYYNFGAKYNSISYGDLYEFSLSYRQPVTPKFGCVGKSTSESNAVDPMKAIFGVPEMTYSLTYVMHDKNKLNNYNLNSNKVANNGYDLEIYHKGKRRIKLTNCYPDTYTPQLAQNGGANMFNIEGSVYGSISFNE